MFVQIIKFCTKDSQCDLQCPAVLLVIIELLLLLVPYWKLILVRIMC